jgi:hypothetical protein
MISEENIDFLRARQARYLVGTPKSQLKQLGDCARRLIEEVATVRSMDVVLPVRENERQQTRQVRLRVVARPDRLVAELLVRLGLDLPSTPKIVRNVVEKTGV